MRPKCLITGLAMIVLLLACSGCGKTTESVRAASPEPSVAAAASASTTIPGQSTPAEPESQSAYYVATGPLLVENQIDVLAQRDGVVTRLFVETGTRVRKGQVLAEMDATQLQADRAAIEADLHGTEANAKNWQAQERVAAADLRRAELMAKADLITKEQLDHAQFAHEADIYQADREQHNIKHFQSRLKSIDYEIQKTRITAPFDGVVARRYVRLGQRIAASDRVFWVSATGPLRLKFTLPQEYMRLIKRGTALSVNVPYAPEPIQTARVTIVGPVVDPATGTVEVTAELTGKPVGILPGMSAEIRVPRQP